MDHDEWKCANCTCDNSEILRFCSVCESSRYAADENTWTCSTCSCSNLDLLRFCSTCGDAKDQLQREADNFWCCLFCRHSNIDRHVLCGECLTPRSSKDDEEEYARAKRQRLEQQEVERLAAKAKADEEAAAIQLAYKLQADKEALAAEVREEQEEQQRKAAQLLQRKEAVRLFLLIQKLGRHEVDLIARVRNMLSQTCLKCDGNKLCIDFRKNDLWCMPCRGGHAFKRMRRELADLKRDPVDKFSAAPVGGDLLHLSCTIQIAAPNSPYHGGKFLVKIVCPRDYPFKCPKIQFTTKMYHPNIASHGLLCCCALANWSPVRTIRIVGRELVSLFENPPVDDLTSSYCVVHPEAARLYKTDRALFDEKAREWTHKHAMRNQTTTPKTTKVLDQPPTNNIKKKATYKERNDRF